MKQIKCEKHIRGLDDIVGTQLGIAKLYSTMLQIRLALRIHF